MSSPRRSSDLEPAVFLDMVNHAHCHVDQEDADHYDFKDFVKKERRKTGHLPKLGKKITFAINDLILTSNDRSD